MLHRKQVAWNSMLLPYVSSDQLQPAGHLFEKMPQRNSTLYLIMINRLSRDVPNWDPNGLDHHQIRANITFSRLKKKDWCHSIISWMVGSSIIQLIKAKLFVDIMKEKNVISCNMISGLLENGHGEEALWFFVHLLQSWSDLKSNLSTCSIVITICFTLAALEQGRQIHAKI
ncbi:pentatricopeptide repeat-containing protein At2g35030, mitochondrial-like [Nymphaea colorata]|nr:pentatricopeptide repeat-containing protein At2g35030, mitochondrial-like [Nymphaea colorata]